MNLEMLLNTVPEDTVIELATEDTHYTFYWGEAKHAFVRPERKTWRHYPVRFVRPHNNELYIEVDTYI